MTKIEWTETTVNVITGCTQYSEGCQNCYAKAMHKRLTAMGQEKYKEPFNKVVCHNILSELNKKINKKTNMCFINSMSDTFHKDVSDRYIENLLYNLSLFPSVNFQILTKRAERIIKFDYPDNVWLGVTVENASYKDRIDYLKKTNAKIKFLSCEPLLSDLGELNLNGIDWVIVGGESGFNARPCHPDWIRNIQKQCQEQRVAFFFKQWGEWKPVYERDKEGTTDNYYNGKESDYYNLTYQKNYTRLNFASGYGFHGDNVTYYQKVGKQKSGCLLDGKEYKEYPQKVSK